MAEVQPPSNEKVCADELQLIEQHGQPYGIRDRSGYLFFFTQIQKFDNQEQRYSDETAQRARLAAFLLSALRSAHEPCEGCDRCERYRDETGHYPYCPVGEGTQQGVCNCNRATPPPCVQHFDEENALDAFREYFVKNYPGPDTIITVPNWHVPKIFRAVLHAIKVNSAAQPPGCDCWEIVSALIKPGELQGNGCDETAQRNGVILAANALFAKRHSETKRSDDHEA